MLKITYEISISVAGLAAGPHQRLDKPFGAGTGYALHQWRFAQGK